MSIESLLATLKSRNPGAGETGTGALDKLREAAQGIRAPLSGPHPDGAMSLHVDPRQQRLIDLAEGRGIEVLRTLGRLVVITGGAADLVALVEEAQSDDEVRHGA
ncbi:hypothetical protein [Sulfuricystis thermophila]|uniref:hypothetical protein n=1 Tax=Sulfuricystis thermophila TaxID=2496847 RepID=UPI001035D1DB|nr:hypothetical protein [Sulfuricystis thermophila]